MALGRIWAASRDLPLIVRWTRQKWQFGRCSGLQRWPVLSSGRCSHSGRLSGRPLPEPDALAEQQAQLASGLARDQLQHAPCAAQLPVQASRSALLLLASGSARLGVSLFGIFVRCHAMYTFVESLDKSTTCGRFWAESVCVDVKARQCPARVWLWYHAAVKCSSNTPASSSSLPDQILGHAEPAQRATASADHICHSEG